MESELVATACIRKSSALLIKKTTLSQIPGYATGNNECADNNKKPIAVARIADRTAKNYRGHVT